MSRDRPRSEYQDHETREDGVYGEDMASDSRDAGRAGPSFVPFGWPTIFSRRESAETYGDAAYDEDYRVDSRRSDDAEGTWLDEGLITLTILAGVVLFLFPEPATSGVGILLITVGVLAWLFDWATERNY